MLPNVFPFTYSFLDLAISIDKHPHDLVLRVFSALAVVLVVLPQSQIHSQTLLLPFLPTFLTATSLPNLLPVKS